MALFRKKNHDALDRLHREELFLTMKPNADRYHGEINFWHGLHKICNELEPGCISMDEFGGHHANDISSGKDACRAFHPGEQTVIIKLKSEDTAIEAADLLNEIFKSTGTHFVAEIPEGSTTPQLRSNIDKIQADKLSVISQFYFDREVTDPQQRKQIGEDCQKIVDAYIKGTPDEGQWKAREGVLPFVSLIGLHGLLRPKERRPLNRGRKEHEMNAHHPHGDPKLFEDVVVHVQCDYKGRVYGVLYDPMRDAFTKAQGGVRFRSFVRELLGGDPLGETKSLGLAVARSGGLIYGVSEALHGNPTVLVIGTVSGVCFGIDMMKQNHNIRKRLRAIKDNLEKKHELEKRIEFEPREPGRDIRLDADEMGNLHAGYTRGEDTIAMSDDSLEMVHYLKAILENGGKDPDTTKVEALAARGFGDKRVRQA